MQTKQVRGAVVLPHGTGKKSKSTCILHKGDKIDEALLQQALAGGEELVPKIQNDGWLDFDAL